MLSDELTVAEAADALGTTPQTVRTLLRKGELRGRKQRWGSRYVWVPSREGVDDFLSEYGRLDGHRRPRPSHHPVPEEPEEPEEPQQPIPFVVRVKPPPADEQTYRIPTEILRARMAPRRPSHRPLLLRARGRASVVVFLVGVPLVLAYSAAPIRADALWFQELGQLDVYRRILEAKVELFLLVATTVALFVGANLAVALRRNGWSRADALGISAASLATASIFGSCAEGHWQTFLLWQHRQTFGSVDPLFGRDIGFFVFTLPFELMVADVLLWLIGFVAGYVAFAYWVRGSFAVQPLRASHKAKLHFAILAATFLLVLAWRLRLEQYALELSQPSSLTGQAFSGKAGTYFWMGASRSILPFSASWKTAVAVMGFETEASRYRVPALAGTLFSRSARPYPPENRSSCCTTTAALRPGMSRRDISALMAASMAASLAAGRPLPSSFVAVRMATAARRAATKCEAPRARVSAQSAPRATPANPCP